MTSNLALKKVLLSISVTLPILLLFIAHHAYAVGYTWSELTGAPAYDWNSVTGSADGTKLASAVGLGGYIYTSTDSGKNWTEHSEVSYSNWYAITSSTDGTKLAAVAYGGDIWTSADSGGTWTDQSTAGTRNWTSITSSSDGTKLAATAQYGYIYTSTDSGAHWTEHTATSTQNWLGIAGSSDGTKLAAVAQNGDVWTSTDSGATWTDQVGSGVQVWRSITSSSDGTKLAAVVYNGDIWTSTNSGVTWTDQTNAGSRKWFFITSSPDGNNLAAVDLTVGNRTLYISANGGVDWKRQYMNDISWHSAVFSADATQLVAAGNGSMYIGVPPTAPVISNVATTTFATSTTITWTTDTMSDSSVYFGTTTNYSATTTNSASTTSHSVTLTGLTACTIYHFSVQSYDENHELTSSSTADATFETTGCVPPVISNVHASSTADGAVITWDTNQYTNSMVSYGLTSSYTASTSNASLVTSHSITLSGLVSCTTYHFQASSTQTTHGLTGTSDDATFMTAGCPVPVISNIHASSTADSATITWDTDLSADSMVSYGLTSSYTASTSDATEVTSHSITLSGLSACTTYHYRISSTESVHSMTGSSLDATFTTTDCPAPVISNVQSTTTTTSATITWNTDLSADSMVSYGLTQSYTASTSNATGKTSHSMNLTSLTTCTTYHFMITSTDVAHGMTSTTTDDTFTTGCVYPPPVISGVASTTATTSVTLTWNTDIAGDSSVSYGNSLSYGLSFYDAQATTSHIASITSLTACTTYHFRLSTTESVHNMTGSTTDATFTTTGCKVSKPRSSGGGGGSSSRSRVATSSVLATTTPITTPIIAIPWIIPSLSPNTSNVWSFIFTRDLTMGVIDPDVAMLQKYLNTHGYVLAVTGPGSPGNETTKFGLLTFASVKKFQAEHGLPSTGFFGPRTRGMINGTSVPVVPVTPVVSAVPVVSGCLSFAMPTLRFGMSDLQTNGDIIKLQQFLIKRGYLKTAPTGNYDEDTAIAVIVYQIMNGLEVTGVTTPETESFIAQKSCE